MTTDDVPRHAINASKAEPVEAKQVRLPEPITPTPRQKRDQEEATEKNARPIEIPIGDVTSIESKGRPTSVREHANDRDNKER
jgi:hypothetical protein